MGLLFALVMLTSGTMGDVPRCLYEATPRVVGDESFQVLVAEEFAKLPLRWRCYVMERARYVYWSPPAPECRDCPMWSYPGGSVIYVAPDAVPGWIDPWWLAGAFVHEAGHLYRLDHCDIAPIHIRSLEDIGAAPDVIDYAIEYGVRDCAAARSGSQP